MPLDLGSHPTLSANDRALISEAVRRVQTSRLAQGGDMGAVLGAVTAAIRDGRRDLFSLVKVGAQVAGRSNEHCV